MTIWRILALSAVAFITSTIASHAGPCSQDIDRMQVQVDAKIERTADTGRFAREARRAFGLPAPPIGPQPAAHNVLEGAPWVSEAMAALARAREADRAGDSSACNQALADVQGAVDR